MIFLILIMIVSLIISGFLFGAYIIFKFKPHLTEKTGATVVYKRHKEDVVIRRRTRETKIDHVTKGIYEYKVGEKYYYKKHTHLFTTFNQAPYMIPIVYIKRFPKISYVNLGGALGDLYYLMGGMVVFCVGVIMPFFLMWSIFF